MIVPQSMMSPLIDYQFQDQRLFLEVVVKSGEMAHFKWASKYHFDIICDLTPAAVSSLFDLNQINMVFIAACSTAQRRGSAECCLLVPLSLEGGAPESERRCVNIGCLVLSLGFPFRLSQCEPHQASNVDTTPLFTDDSSL